MFAFHPFQLSSYPYVVDQPIVYKFVDLSSPTTTTTPTTSGATVSSEKPAKESSNVKQVELPSTPTKTIPSREIEHRFTETETSYKIVLDVPGVKMSDLAIEIANGNMLKVQAQRKLIDGKVVHYQQNFRINKKHVANLSDAKAELVDGVLTIEMIKAKPTEPKVLDVVTTDVPDDFFDKNKNKFLVSFDLPGVKSTDVDAKYHEGNITILANRKRGNNIIKITKSYAINEDEYDVQNLKAYLVDGVFTLYAPCLEKATGTENVEQQQAVQKIIVSVPSLEHDTIATITSDDAVVVDHPTD